MPRRWMPAYVRLMRGIEYEKKHQLSKSELRRLLEGAGFGILRFSLPEIAAADWDQLAGMERIGARLFVALSRIPSVRSLLTVISPVIQVKAVRGVERSVPVAEEQQAALAARL